MNLPNNKSKLDKMTELIENTLGMRKEQKMYKEEQRNLQEESQTLKKNLNNDNKFISKNKKNYEDVGNGHIIELSTRKHQKPEWKIIGVNKGNGKV